MNFFPFHVGDYAVHTRHLSLMEDLAYRRMLDLYYTTEKPLPCAEQTARLIGMREHVAEVSAVLADFFVERDGVYVQSRCDAEIGKYHKKAESARNANQARWSSVERLKSDADQIPTKNQEPRTKNHEPEINTNTACATDAGRVCLTFKNHGINDVNPGHPGLLSLIAAGATDEEFRGAASTAKERGKGFAYAIGMLKRQRAEAAQPPPTRAGPQEPEWRKEQRERNEEFAGPASASRRATKQTAEVIDVTARRLG